MVSLLLPSMTPGLSLIAGGCDRCTPSRSAADAGVVDMPQTLYGGPAPPMTAQRVARCDHYRARNGLPPQKLCREIP